MAAVPLIIPHWYRLIEDLQASPKDFYASVQQAIKRRQVPDARRSRVDWREACSSRRSASTSASSGGNTSTSAARRSTPTGTGSRIAFVSNRDGNYELYVMKPDGSVRRRVTNDLAWNADPAWSIRRDGAASFDTAF